MAWKLRPKSSAMASCMGSADFSSFSEMKLKDSATTVFNVKLAAAILAVEGTMRNSNLFPVKANGDVRFRSELSNGSGERDEVPTRSKSPR